MSIRLPYYFMLVVLQGVVGCKWGGHIHYQGVVTRGYRMVDTNTNTTVIPKYTRDWKVWYCDSIVIQEAAIVYINEDAQGVETWSSGVDYYTYIDLRSRTYFRYSSLSDTARIIKCCYTQPDSVDV